MVVWVVGSGMVGCEAKQARGESCVLLGGPTAMKGVEYVEYAMIPPPESRTDQLI